MRSDFGGHARQAEESTVEVGAGRVEEARERTEGAVAAEVDEGFARPAEEEEDEEDVAESIASSSISFMLSYEATETSNCSSWRMKHCDVAK